MTGRDGWPDWFRLIGGIVLLWAMVYSVLLLGMNAYLELRGHICW